MKYLLSFLILVLGLAVRVGAQQLVFHAGGGLTSLSRGDTRSIGGFKIGVGVEWELSQTLTFEPGLLYFVKGWKDKDRMVYVYDEAGQIVLDDAGNERTGVMNVTSNANYLVLPLLLNYYIPLQLPHYIMFSAGPYVACGVGGKTKARGDTSQEGAARFYHDHNTFDQTDIHRWDAGITLGVGYEFNRMLNAGIETHLGLFNVNKNHSSRHLSFMLTLGYRIPL